MAHEEAFVLWWELGASEEITRSGRLPGDPPVLSDEIEEGKGDEGWATSATWEIGRE